MEEVQQRIQTLELHQSGAMPSLPPLYAKQQPRNVRQLAIDAFHIALDDFPETVDKFELQAYQTSFGPDVDVHEPNTYQQAMASPYNHHWKDATDNEMASHDKNGTWELVDMQPGMNVLSGKWVFKIKRGPDGNITRFKARWVVRGFEQQYGVDFTETFASVVRQRPTEYSSLSPQYMTGKSNKWTSRPPFYTATSTEKST
jgi:hypothetical protein